MTRSLRDSCLEHASASVNFRCRNSIYNTRMHFDMLPDNRVVTRYLLSQFTSIAIRVRTVSIATYTCGIQYTDLGNTDNALSLDALS